MENLLIVISVELALIVFLLISIKVSADDSTEIKIHSDNSSKHLFEIEHAIKNMRDLRGSTLVDLSDINKQLKEINNTLESIKSNTK